MASGRFITSMDVSPDVNLELHGPMPSQDGSIPIVIQFAKGWQYNDTFEFTHATLDKTDGSWWMFSPSRQGYGWFKYQGKQIIAAKNGPPDQIDVWTRRYHNKQAILADGFIIKYVDRDQVFAEFTQLAERIEREAYAAAVNASAAAGGQSRTMAYASSPTPGQTKLYDFSTALTKPIPGQYHQSQFGQHASHTMHGVNPQAGGVGGGMPPAIRYERQAVQGQPQAPTLIGNSATDAQQLVNYKKAAEKASSYALKLREAVEAKTVNMGHMDMRDYIKQVADYLEDAPLDFVESKQSLREVSTKFAKNAIMIAYQTGIHSGDPAKVQECYNIIRRANLPAGHEPATHLRNHYEQLMSNAQQAA